MIRRRKLLTSAIAAPAILRGADALACSCAGPPPPPPGAAAVFKRGVDQWDTGWQQNESILNYTNVNSTQFGPIWETSVDDNQYTQPLYLPQVVVGGNTVNAVITCTVNNTVYCLNADTGATLWTLAMGNAFNSSSQWGSGYQDLYGGNVGILATPVYDSANDRLYVVSQQSRSGTINHFIDVISVASGTRRTGSNVAIAGSNGGQTFDSSRQLQRASLALHPTLGYLMIGVTSHGDQTPYHGWFFTYSYNGSAFTRQAVLCITPTSGGGSIWAAGGPIITDENGAVYITTANGISSPTPGTSASFHDCIAKLTIAAGSITVADYVAPTDWAALDAADEDFAAGAPVMIPNTGAIISTSKNGVHYVAHRSNLGQVGGFAQTWNYGTFPWTPAWCGANNRLYSSPIDQPIGAFQVATAGENLTLGTSTVAQTTVGVPYASYLQISSNGTDASNAIVWAVQAQANPNQTPVTGKLMCFRADTLVELYSSVQNPAAGTGILNAAGGFFNLSKFTPPTVANGKVFVSTNNNSVVAFGVFP